MKTQLTKEQSLHLIELGVLKEKASDESWTSYTPACVGFRYPIFTLTDILEILPKEIVYQELKYQIRIEWDDEWYADYVEDGYNSVITAKSEELIDALYELCVWCLENKYIKL